MTALPLISLDPLRPAERYTGWLKEITMPSCRTALLACLTAVVLGVYGLAACGPLKPMSSTVSDGSVYLATADWILAGRPAGFHSANTALPSGYPSLIAGLKWCGAESGLFAVHLLALASGLAAYAYVARRQLGMADAPIAVCALLAAASLTCFELTSTVASEPVFFALSMGCLACLSRRTVAMIVAGSLLCAAAVSVRMAGVALVPAVCWAVTLHPSVRPLLTRRNVGIASSSAMLCAVVAIGLHPRIEYASIMDSRYNAGADWGVVAGQQIAKLSAFGELATNLPAEWFGQSYQAEFILCGLLVAVVAGIGFYSRLRSLQSVDLYAASYAAILFVYPFFNYGAGRRFLLPILPLVCAYAYLGASKIIGSDRKLIRLSSIVMPAYAAAFTLFGCAAYLYELRGAQ